MTMPMSGISLLAKMAVENSPACRQNQIRHACENRAGNSELPLIPARCTAARQPPIGQLSAFRTPAVFKGNQSRVVAIRATEVKFPDSVLLRILNCLPEQERHGAQIVGTRLRSAIFVDHGVAVPQRDDARDGTPCSRSNTNFEPVAKADSNVPEPVKRLRRHSVAPARLDKEVIKLLQQRVRSS